MSKVTLYIDYVSQPSRAVAWFCLLTKLPHEVKETRIAQGAHKTPEFTKLNPFQKIPTILDGNNAIWESHTILRYLAIKSQQLDKQNDHWYPSEPLARTYVDRYLDWHHFGIRKPMASYFVTNWLKPILGNQADPKEVEESKDNVQNALNDLEKIWLSQTPYLAGQDVSIADLLCVNEITNAALGGLDMNQSAGPKTLKWFNTMKDLPHFNDVHQVLYRFSKKSKNSKL